MSEICQQTVPQSKSSCTEGCHWIWCESDWREAYESLLSSLIGKTSVTR